MRVLFLTHRLPYAPNRGDRVRAYHLLRELAQWAEVDLVSLVHDADEASHAGDLEGIATSVTMARVPRASNTLYAVLGLPTTRPTTHSLLRAPAMAAAVERLASAHMPDVVFSYGTGIAPYALGRAVRNVPLVLDMVDVDSAKWQMLARTSPPPLSWIYAREARLLRQFEADLAARAQVTLVVTEKEKAALAQFAGHARIEVVENGVDVEGLRRPKISAARSSTPTVVFCGVMNYAPNVEGVNWLVREVWPIVKRTKPNARLQIVGSHPSSTVRRLEYAGLDVQVTGEVPDVRPYLWDATVAVAPLLTARGVQNKVLEAVAAGLRAVVTPVVFEGLPREVRSACVVAQKPQEFAAAILAMLDVPLGGGGHAPAPAVDLATLSWGHRLAPLREVALGISRDAAR